MPDPSRVRVTVECHWCEGTGTVKLAAQTEIDAAEKEGRDIVWEKERCRIGGCDGTGKRLATLRDPAAEALMADGERYRNRVPEAIAILTSGSAYERMQRAGDSARGRGRCTHPDPRRPPMKAREREAREPSVAVATTRLDWRLQHGSLPDGATLTQCIIDLVRAVIREEARRAG